MTRRTAGHGMKIFLILWFGQTISTLGTGLGSFALGVWIYQETGSATLFAIMAFLAATTALVLSPFAGVAADRWDRRWVMVLADLGSGVMTALMAYALWADRLQIWHAYVIAVVMTGFGVFQGPAFVASVSSLVPREHLARASGMSQMGRSISQIVSPILAGVLVMAIGYHGVILIDFATFLFAVGTLFLIRIPRPHADAEARDRGSIRRNIVLGWTYIRQRAGLLSLLVLFAITNFSLGIVQVLITPMILAFSSPAGLGTVQSAGATGALLGALLLSLWGGPRRRVWGIFAFILLEGFVLFLGGARPNVALVAFAACLFMFSGPFINGLSQAIWQSKVAHGLQGRVFAMRQMIAMSTAPVAYLVAGPLADQLFNPLLAPGGPLADTLVGRIVGVGPERGVGLLFIVLGALIVLVTAVSYLNPRLRHVEEELPDADSADEGAMGIAVAAGTVGNVTS